MRHIDTLVVHHSASANNVRPELIKRWHLDRGFRDVGYHFLVTVAGTLFYGRPVEDVGAHVKGHNQHSLGICVIGDMRYPDDPKQAWSTPQHETLARVIEAFWLFYPEGTVVGHSDLADTKCPGIGNARLIADRLKPDLRVRHMV